MKSKFCRLGVVVLSATIMLGIAGCVPPGGGDPVFIEGKVSGGGGLDQPDLTRATFTYQGSSCGAPDVPVSGHFNFLDKDPLGTPWAGVKNGVMADGDITDFSVCTDAYPTWNPDANNGAGGCAHTTGVCPAGGYMFRFNYRNKNAKVPAGQGVGGGCVVDNGEGRKAPGPDLAAIGFQDGPYAGYQTQGIVGGNVQGHLCD